MGHLIDTDPFYIWPNEAGNNSFALKEFVYKNNNLYVAKMKEFKNGSIDSLNDTQTFLSSFLERHIENTSKLRGDDLKFYIYHFYDNGNIKEIIPLQRRVVNFLGQKAERDESFCIDGYINKYDTQGGHIGAINYINGKKQECFE